jgi:PAS domain-containing protein
VIVADAMSTDSHTRAASLEQRLFEVVPDPLVVTGTDGRIIRANPAACAIAARGEEELLASS